MFNINCETGFFIQRFHYIQFISENNVIFIKIIRPEHNLNGMFLNRNNDELWWPAENYYNYFFILFYILKLSEWMIFIQMRIIQNMCIRKCNFLDKMWNFPISNVSFFMNYSIRQQYRNSLFAMICKLCMKMYWLNVKVSWEMFNG